MLQLNMMEQMSCFELMDEMEAMDVREHSRSPIWMGYAPISERAADDSSV